jgi:hypothetical protein
MRVVWSLSLSLRLPQPNISGRSDECMMTNASTSDAGDILLRQSVLAPPLDWDDDCERELRYKMSSGTSSSRSNALIGKPSSR